MNKTVVTLSICAIAVICAINMSKPTAVAPADAARAVIEHTNDHRDSIGENPLTRDSHLDALAEQWAEQMADAGNISHRDTLGEDAWAAGARFAEVGENVGVGDDIDAINDAFLASADHRANIEADDWTRIGVGTATGDDGRIYVAVNFSDGNTGR